MPYHLTPKEKKMEWLNEHKYYFIGGAGLILLIKVATKKSAPAASDQQPGGGTTIIGSSSPVSSLQPASALTTGGQDMNALYASQVAQAQTNSITAKTAILSTNSLDTLNSMLANVGMGQEINIAYNENGQVVAADKRNYQSPESISIEADAAKNSNIANDFWTQQRILADTGTQEILRTSDNYALKALENAKALIYGVAPIFNDVGAAISPATGQPITNDQNINAYSASQAGNKPNDTLSQQIRGWFADHNNASDTEIASAMSQFHVTSEQVAAATGTSLATVKARVAAATGAAQL